MFASPLHKTNLWVLMFTSHHFLFLCYVSTLFLCWLHINCKRMVYKWCILHLNGIKWCKKKEKNDWWLWEKWVRLKLTLTMSAAAHIGSSLVWLCEIEFTLFLLCLPSFFPPVLPRQTETTNSSFLDTAAVYRLLRESKPLPQEIIGSMLFLFPPPLPTVIWNNPVRVNVGWSQQSWIWPWSWLLPPPPFKYTIPIT